jgi:hypothetical protein
MSTLNGTWGTWELGNLLDMKKPLHNLANFLKGFGANSNPLNKNKTHN